MATAICEKHKLRFDPEMQSGCVLCRKEAAAAAGIAPPSPAAEVASRVSHSAAETGSAGGILAPLGVAAAIWVVSALTLYTVHQEMAAVYVFEETAIETASGDAPEGGAEDPGFVPSPAPGTAPGQTDAVLREIEALQGQEPHHPAETGAPPGLPSSEQLAPQQGSGSEEEPSTDPVEIVVESGEPPPEIPQP